MCLCLYVCDQIFICGLFSSRLVCGSRRVSDVILTLSRHMMHVLYINCLYYLMFHSYYVITKQVVSLFVVNTCFVLSLYFLLCLMFVLAGDGCL